MAIQLQVVLGKQRGKNLTFSSGEFVFGRGPECHVRPNSELVSRQHCMLRVAKETATIRDLGSANGTLVNGSRVREEQPLSDGDRIQLGPFVLLVKIPHTELKIETVTDSRLCAQTQNGESPLIKSAPKITAIRPATEAAT
jgi:pSer/pThr/pTyr-binding forkhead associated (FHA) protein